MYLPTEQAPIYTLKSLLQHFRKAGPWRAVISETQELYEQMNTISLYLHNIIVLTHWLLFKNLKEMHL